MVPQSFHMVMPEDLNPHGTLFGGKIMAEMDKFASILAMQMAGKNVVTRYVSEIHFTKPIQKDDIYILEVENVIGGTTSVEVNVVVYRQKLISMIGREEAVRAKFVFVAVDENGKKTEINKR